MGLEVATIINQLVESNPLGTDNRSQGDDHIRLIKSCLKTTFPNITEAVTVTAAQINKVGQPGVVCFPGMIVMWSGTVANIPAGWKLCNGVGSTTVGPVPNLTNRFVAASGGDSGFTYNTNQTGGSTFHNHLITVAGTALTVDQMPTHSHASGTLGDNVSYQAGRFAAGGPSGFPAVDTQPMGGGQAHSHGGSSDLQAHLPPYYALAFIIKN